MGLNSEWRTVLADLEEFEPLAETAYRIAILQQPFLAAVGVYGPMLMTTQNHAVWGAISASARLKLNRNSEN